LWLAATIVHGVSFTGWRALVAAALVLGIVNAVIRPILLFLTFPITLLTLGLFILVVNGFRWRSSLGWCRASTSRACCRRCWARWS